MPNLVLYNYFRSTPSYRVRIALHLKELDFEYKAIPLLSGEQFSPEYLKINPQAEVPALIHNGRTIAQSLAILEYLDEVFPGERLYPEDSYQRALVRQFCENINSFLHPLSNLKVTKYLSSTLGLDEGAREAWVHHWYNMGLQTLEKILAKESGKFCFGDQISAADLCLIPLLTTARRFKMTTHAFPLIERIEAECLKVPAFQKAHPFRQPDTPADLRIT